MSQPLVNINSLTLKYQKNLVLKDLEWKINKGENWLLSGESGTGKTSLAEAIAKNGNKVSEIAIHFNNESKLPAKVLFIESWYQFKNVEGVANFYYQQRYTSKQAKDTVTVATELLQFGTENSLSQTDLIPILLALNFDKHSTAQLIELSSGEHKKLQLVKALWLKPQLLIIDQPYTGLDRQSRTNLNLLLNQVTDDGVQLILINNDAELPSCINCFAIIRDGKLFNLDAAPFSVSATEKKLKETPHFLKASPSYASDEMVKMIDVNISYGEKNVLKSINWEVNAGERWLLQGHNGSGKSTLLSLVNGDHPQSYANELYLFGNRRGSGESIWDIKQRIGLISPEFHWYFDNSSTVWQSIASGFYDTIGLLQELPFSKSEQVSEVVEFFGLADVKNEKLATLPLGKQRLALLARTIIKNPELLILDEPCQGLDQNQTLYFNQLVDQLCSNGMTIIYVGHFESQLPTCLTHRLVLENGKVILNTKAYENIA
ncbi:MAG: ATP-binding cassette domain-containing protein [Pedobacter sp.]|nr:MAG: ATP-binding cassette domain-containing protein [Pedobacter sp.]